MKVKPTRSMPADGSKKLLPTVGPLFNGLRARAGLHAGLGAVLDHCTWCGDKTETTPGGAVLCPTCDDPLP